MFGHHKFVLLDVSNKNKTISGDQLLVLLLCLNNANNISGDLNFILLFYVETNQTICGDRKLVLLFVLKNTQTSLANGTKHRFPYLKIANVFACLWPEVRCDLAEKAEPNL